MFELTKKEFLRENGVLNVDATKRSDMYTNMYRKVAKEERLAAGNTLSQYERAYRQAFVDVVKEVDNTTVKLNAINGGISTKSTLSSRSVSGTNPSVSDVELYCNVSFGTEPYTALKKHWFRFQVRQEVVL